MNRDKNPPTTPPADNRQDSPLGQGVSRVYRVGNRPPQIVYVDITDRNLIDRIFVKRGDGNG